MKKMLFVFAINFHVQILRDVNTVSVLHKNHKILFMQDLTLTYTYLLMHNIYVFI